MIRNDGGDSSQPSNSGPAGEARLGSSEIPKRDREKEVRSFYRADF